MTCSRFLLLPLLSNTAGRQSWKSQSAVGSDAIPYTATFHNPNPRGDFLKCSGLATELLHLESNAWCNFAHGGDCSFAGIYQPPLPMQNDEFGEFFAFANYLHLWKFLRLPPKSSIGELRNGVEKICEMSWVELKEFDHGRNSEEEVRSESQACEGGILSLLTPLPNSLVGEPGVLPWSIRSRHAVGGLRVQP